MRLYEIINTVAKTRKMSVPFSIDTMKDKKAKADQDFFNTAKGAYAYGKENPKDPHEFVKSSFMPSKLEIDAYYQYVQAIRPYIKDNPFFPRVYVIDIKQDSTGLQIPRYHIEALKSYEEFSIRSIVGIGESLFNDFHFEYDLDDENHVYDAWNGVLMRVNRLLLDIVSGYGPTRAAQSPKLIQACEVIQEVLGSNPKFKLDTHSGNFMLRGTSVGPQLVITDPMHDGGRSVVGAKQWHPSSNS